MVSNELVTKLRKRLQFIYKNLYTEKILEELIKIIDGYVSEISPRGEDWSQEDTVLITYGDSLLQKDKVPLQVLSDFLFSKLRESFTHVHILPFFPYSSDDGFSVIDYKKVDPHLGNWENVIQVGKNFCLMVDLVINHISSQSQWFGNFLQGKDPGKDYFIVMDPREDLSAVTRPRNTPLLTPYNTTVGEKYVWTTFSADQVDLNFSNPRVFLEMMDILLFYVSKGARIIRLDAIAFLWKEVGTSCLHLPETHEVVKIMRDILEEVSPSVKILTETNVPNKENLEYFGQQDEAHMVYQFSLPPLLLHSLHTGNALYFNKWAGELPNLPPSNTFFNFTASHDGIGVRPLEGLVPPAEIKELLDNMKKLGGHVSMKANPDGSESPYEINITYFDALQETQQGGDPYQKERFLCSQTIMMAMRGIPAFYIHSLLATRNYHQGVEETGRARTINRRKYTGEELKTLLSPGSIHFDIFRELTGRIQLRKKIPGFHPGNVQEILDAGNECIAIKRSTKTGTDLYCLANITNHPISISLKGLPSILNDLLTGKKFECEKDRLDPYQVVWLAP